MFRELAFQALVACNWSNPGHDPYAGSAAAAIDQFAIPAEHRAGLRANLAAGKSVERFAITKDAVIGQKGGRYASFMLMTFGQSKLCYGVDRSKWQDAKVEYGSVYCSGDWCIGVPDVCGNITQLFPHKVVETERPVPEVVLDSVRKDSDLRGWRTDAPVLPPLAITHTVPEPSTMFAMLVPLLWLTFRNSWARKRS